MKWIWPTVLAAVLALSGCAGERGIQFTADVLEINGQELLVEALQDEAIRSAGSKFRFTAENSEELAVGNRLVVTFDGMVLGSWPGTLPHVFSVKKVDNDG